MAFVCAAKKLRRFLLSISYFTAVAAICFLSIYGVSLVLKRLKQLQPMQHCVIVCVYIVKSVNTCKYFATNGLWSLNALRFFVLLSSPRGVEAWRSEQLRCCTREEIKWLDINSNLKSKGRKRKISISCRYRLQIDFFYARMAPRVTTFFHFAVSHRVMVVRINFHIRDSPK